MNLQSVFAAWPHVDAQVASSVLKQVDRSRYPELDAYPRAEVYRDIQGEGGLFLACDMARELGLKPGARVLDLACGTGATSIFLAKNSGVQVFAVDKLLDEPGLAKRASEAGLANLVVPGLPGGAFPTLVAEPFREDPRRGRSPLRASPP